MSLRARWRLLDLQDPPLEQYEAAFVEPAGNGRLRIPASQRNAVGIEKKAVLLGMGAKFELWSEQAHHEQIRQPPGDTDLDQALGRPLFGRTAFTEGVAQPSIGRLGRVTCGFGLPANGRGVPPVEVGASTYKDVESATTRVETTISQLRSIGASQTS